MKISISINYKNKGIKKNDTKNSGKLVDKQIIKEMLKRVQME